MMIVGGIELNIFKKVKVFDATNNMTTFEKKRKKKNSIFHHVVIRNI